MKKTITIILFSSIMACNYPVSNAAKKISDKVNKTCQVLSIQKSANVSINDDNSQSTQNATDFTKFPLLERTAQLLTW